ncbi:MAG: PAS domain S-box protein [Salinivirgaceae bacterium]|nr:PAS domain S-box protein [Salinivirgaceae bacterium]
MEAFIDKIKKLFIYKVNNRINFTPTLVGLSVVILVLSWILGFIKGGYTASLSSLVELHKTSPAYFIIDLLPIFMGILGYAFTKSQQETIDSLETQITEKDHVINMNALFAKKIGEGDLAANDAEINDNDILGHSLKKMRENLALTNEKEKEQNWIAKGKDTISDILRLQNDLGNLSYLTLVELIKYIDVIQGAFYIYNEEDKTLENTATYAYNRRKYIDAKFQIGEGLVGQCAYEMDVIYRREIPDEFVTITSGILGDKKPNSLLLVPLITDEKLQGVLEFASLKDDISELKIRFLKELSDIIARTIFNLKVNTRTEKLLKDAQEMTEELQENEEELRQNAEEMRATHEELEKTNSNLQTQIRAVENAQKRQHALLENASEIISIYDEELKLKYISPSVVNIYGYTIQEMIDGKDIDRLTAKGVKEFTETLRKVAEDASSTATIQYTYMRKDGQKIYIESTCRNLLDDPAINGLIINSRDITERKRAEKEERMKSKMQSLSENSLDLILRIGTNGQFFYANPMVKTFTGIEISDIINKNLDDVAFEPTIKEFFSDAVKTVRSTNSKHDAEVTFPTTFGDRIMQVNAIPEFSDDNKELETILFVAHDITEQKMVEIEIQEKNKAITESINYAKRIQTAILPNTKFIQEFLPKSFIFYRPKDVVSGDFPWFFKKGDDLFIAVVDCTGHGVPGALLSFIGYFTLNNVVDHYDNIDAGVILDKLHEGVRTTLKQDRIDTEARDGMDVALCKINLKKNILEFAGAHRPLYLLRGNELTQYKGSHKAIGGIPLGKKPEADFENHLINLKPKDRVFFFSDGLPDQVSGETGRKYQASRIRDLLVEHYDVEIYDYEKIIYDDFIAYKGDYKQVDDILLIGIEF